MANVVDPTIIARHDRSKRPERNFVATIKSIAARIDPTIRFAANNLAIILAVRALIYGGVRPNWWNVNAKRSVEGKAANAVICPAS